MAGVQPADRDVPFEHARIPPPPLFFFLSFGCVGWVSNWLAVGW